MSGEQVNDPTLLQMMKVSINYGRGILQNLHEHRRGAEETVKKLLLNSNLDPAEYEHRTADLAEDTEALRKELYLALKKKNREDEEESATGSDLREKIENQEMLKAVLRQKIGAGGDLAVACEKNEEKCRKMRDSVVEAKEHHLRRQEKLANFDDSFQAALQRPKDAEIKLFKLQEHIARLQEKELALRENSGKSGPNDERMASIAAKMEALKCRETDAKHTVNSVVQQKKNLFLKCQEMNQATKQKFATDMKDLDRKVEKIRESDRKMYEDVCNANNTLSLIKELSRKKVASTRMSCN